MGSGGNVRQMGERAPLTIEDRLVQIIETTVADAITRAEARGEERARALRTHLSIPEAATALGISQAHCRRHIDAGDIPALRLGERVVIPRRALEELGT